MKATELLRHQHDEVDVLLDHLIDGDRQPRELLESLAQQAAAQLIVERELFYPVLQAADGALVRQGFEEHALIGVMLRRLLSQGLERDKLHVRLELLRELLTHHQHAQEAEVFSRVEATLGEAGSSALAERMRTLLLRALNARVETTLSRAAATMPTLYDLRA